MSTTAQPTFTAAQIALPLEKSPQAVRKALRDVEPTGLRIVAGNETVAWTVEQLPALLVERLDSKRIQARCRTIEDLLSMPRQRWQPAIPLDKICDRDIQAATKLREALKPWLVQQHDPNLSGAEIENRGIADYNKVFGNRITPRYWRELFTRALRRDNGAEEWNRLEIYLPDRLKQKSAPADVVSEALAESFADIENLINNFRNPQDPSKEECEGVWQLALAKFSSLVSAGDSEKSAARYVRQFLFARASFLCSSRDSLLKAFKRKLKTPKDGRVNNGKKADIPAEEIDLLRSSAAFENGGRVDAAWREKYSRLSELTRQQNPDSQKAPRKVHRALNRKLVDALTTRHHGGKRALRRMVGGLHGNRWAGIPSMHSWAVDDVTSNIEVASKNPDGSPSLILPQIIFVQDSAARKIVGWSISADKGPTAGLVSDAVLDAFRKNNIPKELWVENGYVFGKSLLINGKVDDMGRTVVCGLAQHGCSIHHFGKMNPTAKAELERSFEAMQRLMERHPGYTGRHQMIDAPDEFKREQRLINSGKVEATQFRYTLEEFKVVIDQIILEYNSTPNWGGQLKGATPDEAFLAMRDKNDPPIEYSPELEFIFENEKTIVPVEVGGVRFVHRSSGRQIKVRGGQLAHFVGSELWAWVNRKDASMVTFMNLDYTNPFTMEVCSTPSARERSFAPDSGVLASEISKIREHERAIEDEYKRLLNQHGNPRRELLNKVRNQPEQTEPACTTISDGVRRVTVLNGQLAKAGEQMEKQRREINAQKDQKMRRTRANKSKALRNGIPSVLVSDDEQSSRALELLAEGGRETAEEIETAGGNEPQL